MLDLHCDCDSALHVYKAAAHGSERLGQAPANRPIKKAPGAGWRFGFPVSTLITRYTQTVVTTLVIHQVAACGSPVRSRLQDRCLARSDTGKTAATNTSWRHRVPGVADRSGWLAVAERVESDAAPDEEERLHDVPALALGFRF